MKRTELRRKKALARGTGLARKPFRREKKTAVFLSQTSIELQVRPAPSRAARKGTGFPRAVKLAVRKRAGNGEIDDAACEACGIWLGRYGGQVQHIVARGRGGSRLRDVITNAALLCGSSLDLGTCHGKCEARDPHYREMGFWRKSSDEPSPVMLHGSQGGVTVWLNDLGHYLDEDGNVITSPGRAA